MLLFAIIVVVLLIWSLILTTRIVYLGKIVADMKKRLGTLSPSDPFSTALRRAQASLDDDTQ